MTKLGICTGIVLAVAGASWAVDVSAAEITPMLRFIHNRYFVELGVNTDRQARASFMYVF